MKVLLQHFIRFALIHIRRDPFRIFLNIFELLVGISAVVMIVSLNLGMQIELDRFFNLEGRNIISLMSRENPDYLSRLTHHDLYSLEGYCPEIIHISPEINSFIPVTLFDQKKTASVFQIGPEYRHIKNLKLLDGRWINEIDLKSGNKVCVLAWNKAVNQTSDGQPLIGTRIDIGGQFYEVVGLVNYNRYSVVKGDYVIYIPAPYPYFQSTLPFVDGQVLIQVSDKKYLESVNKSIIRLIPRFWNKTNFSVTSITTPTTSELELTRRTNLILTFIALIALLAGSVGIMNIMVTSVMERKTEIGIKKAIGASNNDIILEFLIESSLISLMGGILGILTGIVLAIYVESLYHLPIVIPVIPVLWTALFSISIGVISGLYPAYKAAKLDPIDALGKS